MKPETVLVIRFNLSELWKIILWKVRVVYVCEELEASSVFLKQTQRHRTSG